MKKNHLIAGGLILLALLTFNLQPLTAFASGTWYVWQNSPANGPGTAWNNAFHDIQSAVNVAATGDTVLVTNGVYDTGGIITPGYILTNRVYITNAITLKSVNGPAATAIVGVGGASGAWIYNNSNSVRCVYMGANAGLSGFTLTNGCGSVPMGNEYNSGGVWCPNGGVITNCILTGNGTMGNGGGVFGATLFNCTLTGNVGGNGGGAAGCVLNNCVLTGNAVGGNWGGGAYNCTLNNCILGGNLGSGSPNGGGGGGAYCTLNGCTLTNNSAFGGGGALVCTLNDCTLLGNQGGSYGGGVVGSVLTNCVLIGNSGVGGGYGEFGGGAWGSTLYNCLIAGNLGTYGAGVCQSTLINCTVVSNTASSAGGGAGDQPWGGGLNIFLTNCIVWNNSAPAYSNYDTNCVLSYCCATSLAAGPGNIASDPQFANPAAGDYHLLASSPCINAGNNAAVVGSTDLDGFPRIFGGTVDMGAYEYQGMPLVPPTITNSIASTTVASGGSVTLTVGVSGTPPFTYQWCCNGAPIAGATNATLTISNFSPANAGAYTVTVSSPLGSVTSPPATLASVDLKLFAGVIVNGPVGSNYLIQATSNLSGGWTTLTNVALPAQPYIFIDYNSPWNPQQFYRAVPQ